MGFSKSKWVILNRKILPPLNLKCIICCQTLITGRTPPVSTVAPLSGGQIIINNNSIRNNRRAAKNELHAGPQEQRDELHTANYRPKHIIESINAFPLLSRQPLAHFSLCQYDMKIDLQETSKFRISHPSQWTFIYIFFIYWKSCWVMMLRASTWYRSVVVGKIKHKDQEENLDMWNICSFLWFLTLKKGFR